MDKYEYKSEVISNRANTIIILNNFGLDGWELCAIEYLGETNTSKIYFFKRKIIC